MQKWEYNTILRSRSYGTIGSQTPKWDIEVETQLSRLGYEGWELVSVVPRSGVSGDAVAGLTTEELWIFKRLGAQ